MLRLSCCVCGSMFLVAKLPTDPPLCVHCAQAAAGNSNPKPPKRKPRRSAATAKPADTAGKGQTDGTDSPP